jgi:peptidoglycan/LPS O-acetylase OafA/YrhL
MRCLKRSLVTLGRSSVCGRGVPSGARSGGSVAGSGSATAAAVEGALLVEGATAGALATIEDAGAADAPLGEWLASGRWLGMEDAVLARGARDGDGSPRQAENTSATSATELRFRAGMSLPSILDRGAQRLSVQRPPEPSASAAHQRFLDTPKLPGLDGLRCLAILPVVFHHATPRLLPGIAGKGAVGVDLFFALSGFLITTLLLRERRAAGHVRLGAFYARRSLRIFPLYYAVLGAYALRAMLLPPESSVGQHFLRSLPYHATYTANWFVDYAVPHPVMFAFSWSLCVEEQFYWVWPVLVALVPRRTVLAALMLGAIAIDALAEHAAFSAWMPPGSLGLRVLTSFATPIGFGSVLALTLDSSRGFRVARWVLGLRASAPLLLALSVTWLLVPYTPYLALSFTLAALVGSVVVRPDHGLRWLLDTRLARHVGALSYAVYLVHVTALGLVRRYLPDYAEQTLIVFGLGLPLSLAFAELLHRGIERPFLKLRARFH